MSTTRNALIAAALRLSIPRFNQLEFTSTATAADCRKTQEITACTYDGATLVTDIDHAESWPPVLGPFDASNQVYANQWLAVQVSPGRWLAGIGEYLRARGDFPGGRQREKLVEQPISGTRDNPAGEGTQFYDRNRWQELCDWRPVDGEIIGVFVTTQLRGGVLSPTRERSNVAWLRLSVVNGVILSGELVAIEGNAGEMPEPSPAPNPAPVPEPPPAPVPPPAGDAIVVALERIADAVESLNAAVRAQI